MAKVKEVKPEQQALATHPMPEVVTLVIGEWKSGASPERALFFVRSQGAEVLSVHPVEFGAHREPLERSWREWAWRRYFQGEALPPEGDASAVVVGAGLGLFREGKRYVVVRVEVDGQRLVSTEVRDKDSTSLHVAWEALEMEATLHLLEEERFDSVQRKAGWWGKKSPARAGVGTR